MFLNRFGSKSSIYLKKLIKRIQWNTNEIKIKNLESILDINPILIDHFWIIIKDKISDHCIETLIKIKTEKIRINYGQLKTRNEFKLLFEKISKFMKIEEYNQIILNQYILIT